MSTIRIAVASTPLTATIAEAVPAAIAAVDEAARLLVDHWDFTIEDAFIFLSVACDVGIAQACQPSPASAIARVKVPKISACPAPFRR